ncbi:hypothetical protein [uncultured Clostridium sp.]|uniref:hypothetical protein n=1 Tax=uncultured Clostridium sp. TaxID=59620 RepID=UPI0028E9A97B|nr:hypothetical protein [uncultured Clostridium sp.]
MKTTINYGLKKPEGTDVVNIEDLNYNADIIDQKIKEVDTKASNIKVPVTSVNGKTGAVTLAASDVGAVPTGRKVNSKPLSADIALSATDIKAADGKTLEVFKTGVTSELAQIASELNKHEMELAKLSSTNGSFKYYVDIVNGSDTNDGLTVATAFKSIKYAISKLPRTINNLVSICVLKGDYSSEGIIYLDNFYGSGILTLTGYDGTKDIDNASKAVDYKVKGLIVSGCLVRVSVYGLSSSSSYFKSTCSMSVRFWYCNNTYTSPYSTAFEFEGTPSGEVRYCIASNKQVCVKSDKSKVISGNWTSASTNNSFGLSAVDGGVISKDPNSSQPVGTSANENTSWGGVIR